ncbi:unnamed protein product [Orchesella dallaii]|uniref:Uncharacterized protein n=1 Tax=Orchesella dallaii TaxID=48710 RepID=A0ABP1RL03_9HEXA
MGIETVLGPGIAKGVGNSLTEDEVLATFWGMGTMEIGIEGEGIRLGQEVSKMTSSLATT